MRKFEITFRQQVTIYAETKKQAMSIFENINLNNLKKELSEKVIIEASFLEQNSINEL